MLGVKSKTPGAMFPAGKVRTTTGGGGREAAAPWEIRPGGMLVQKRNSDSNQGSIPVPSIRVKVKYESSRSYHEINISSQASFGELKKMLAGPTGLNPLDQKLVFKEKERDSKAFLDVAGVKDGSKLVLIDDVMSRERRFVETLKYAKMDKANKEIGEISLEVDKLAKQVEKLELEICGGKKVVETVLLNLIEVLMTQLIKLDGIVADGDVKLQRRMQVKRVQRYIETLDKLKMGNSMIENNGVGAKVSVPSQQQNKISTERMPAPNEKQQNYRNLRGNIRRPVVVTTEWETFDSGAAMKLPFTPPIQRKHATTNGSAKLNWEFFE